MLAINFFTESPSPVQKLQVVQATAMVAWLGLAVWVNEARERKKSYVFWADQIRKNKEVGRGILVL